MTSVRTHLWFGNDRAVEAAEFYAEHIPGSSVGRVLTAWTEPGTSVAEIVEFTIAGHDVIGLNAGPDFHLNEAFSFYLLVDGQEEVDHYWEILTADGGEPGPCGWCKDRYGVSWQVVPRGMDEVFSDEDPERAQRAFAAMMSMTKLDIAALEAAAEGAKA